MEGRRLLTIAFTSTEYVVPAGAPAASIQVRYLLNAGLPDPNAEDHVELTLYAEGADPAVDAPLARVPIVSTMSPSPPGKLGAVPLPASAVVGQTATVPLPAGASGSLALKLVGNAPREGLPPEFLQTVPVDATLHVVDRADVTPPQLVSVRQVARGRKVEAIEVTFSEPMDRATAEDPSNYAVTAHTSVWSAVMRPATPEQQAANLVPISRASYDPATRTVTLTPARPITSNPLNNLFDPADYRSMLAGRQTPSRLTDEAGNRLDSDGDGSPDGFLRTRGSMMVYGPTKQAQPRRTPPMRRPSRGGR